MAGIKVTIDGNSYELTPYNCAVYVFPKEFSAHNHLFLVPDPEADEGIYIFGRQDVLDTLMKSGMVCVHYLVYVPDPDIAAYRRWVENQGTREVIDTTAEEVAPLTEEEVNYYAKEFQEERVIDHWDELDDG